MQFGFEFDIDRCVGCHACIVACSVENDLVAGESWRHVYTYNPLMVENREHFSLSLSCNHCKNAPCIESCPAVAISKDKTTGVVTIDESRCIGCKYCSWVCPWESPVFDNSEKIMKKCDFCSDRVSEGLNPACVAICPTNALKISEIEPEKSISNIPGFSDLETGPAVSFTEDSRRIGDEIQYVNPYSREISDLFIEKKNNDREKISMRTEWTLLLFTFLISILGGIFSKALFDGLPIRWDLWFVSGMASLLLSSVHLGKKSRFFRAVLNWRSSWLSREVISFVLFMFFSLIYLLTEYKPAGWIGLISAVSTSISADAVYRVAALKLPGKFYSSDVTLTLFFFGSIFNRCIYGVITTAAIKLFLFYKESGDDASRLLRFMKLFGKIVTYMIFPVVYISMNTNSSTYILLLFLLTDQFLDRMRFYKNNDIVTPGYCMKEHFELNKSIKVDKMKFNGER